MREKTGRRDELASSRLRVGAAIRERRLAAGLSLAELADRIGVALSTMSKIENGKISTSFERLDSVSRALQADITEFLGTAVPMAMQQSSAYGMRRSITRPEDGTMVDAGSYLEWFHASDMLQKRFQPVVAELLIEDVAEYGAFTQHSGEEFNYVLEGEMEFHTEIYAPVRLTAGSSIYFDAEMKHAHVRVGSSSCRILAILCPRMEPLGAASPDRRSMRIVDPHGKASAPVADK
ncbi:DNA-binding XRE family transcriptional regulator/mannose-6-phosphate isomerase-like protein (cupin superfamily) [Sphingopyxis panaciterrae]|uniref:helix-turn-helix domain-containing protein n=1 Tax=Sphingopyxis panaciterrae TaxID=363841 RepID=UPI0014238568|nr:XRE family transcriptional regulator [Sphingopyxis panaciterrae]NIJ38706.1 DNA-binding XRE family transcriptional regulator/mannose-6-phosphate isomerase-like protein (cupin superfamily) [Sphingopyxis panaciterrae]